MEVWGKLLERLFLARLEGALESSGAPEPVQLPKGPEYLGILLLVINATKEEIQKPCRSRGICVLVAIEVNMYLTVLIGMLLYSTNDEGRSLDSFGNNN